MSRAKQWVRWKVINDFITILPTFICLKQTKTTKQKANEQGDKKKREENENEIKNLGIIIKREQSCRFCIYDEEATRNREVYKKKN